MANTSFLSNCLRLGAAVAFVAAAPALRAEPVEYLQPAKPYKDSAFLQGVTIKPVDLSRGTLRIPLITWAADGVTMSANGGLAPNPNSSLARAVKMPVQLELVD